MAYLAPCQQAILTELSGGNSIISEYYFRSVGSQAPLSSTGHFTSQLAWGRVVERGIPQMLAHAYSVEHSRMRGVKTTLLTSPDISLIRFPTMHAEHDASKSYYNSINQNRHCPELAMLLGKKLALS